MKILLKELAAGSNEETLKKVAYWHSKAVIAAGCNDLAEFSKCEHYFYECLAKIDINVSTLKEGWG